MNNFLIGFFKKCDDEKFQRDFLSDFFGVEASLFPNEDEIAKLAEKARSCQFSWGVHYPLLQNQNQTRDPLFLALEENKRKKAFEEFEREVALTARWGGQYILTHFPKPVLVADTLMLDYWRFANEYEWMYERDYPTALLKANLRDMFIKLSEISVKHKIKVVLENDAISPYLAHSSLLEEMFQAYLDVSACLDIGRLHLQQQADSMFDAMAFAAKLAPYTFIVHLWNTTLLQNREGGHLPVLPSQKKEDGYADIETYLRIILKAAPHAKILFEHNSNVITVNQLRECYTWVNSVQQNIANS